MMISWLWVYLFAIAVSKTGQKSTGGLTFTGELTSTCGLIFTGGLSAARRLISSGGLTSTGGLATWLHAILYWRHSKMPADKRVISNDLVNSIHI